MGEGDLNVIAFQMDDVIKTIDGHIIGQQVLQAMTAGNAAVIIENRKTRI